MVTYHYLYFRRIFRDKEMNAKRCALRSIGKARWEKTGRGLCIGIDTSLPFLAVGVCRLWALDGVSGSVVERR